MAVGGRALGWAACASALLGAAGQPAHAFPHVVRPGETLAQIAERTYGHVEMEKLLVAANGLDLGTGIPIVPGMRLEVPSVAHYRVAAGESWASLANDLLGDPERSDVIALANASMPWLTPLEGQEIIVPYNLRFVATQSDSTLTVAYRFLGDRDKAWMLDRYNRLKGKPIHRGDVLLVPLTDLPLSPEGRTEANAAYAAVRSEGAGSMRDAQRRADAELPALATEIRGGRYVEAIARGNKLLGYGDLAKAQLAAIHRALTEAYVALDANGLAETACGGWRQADPAMKLDPVELSPKILRACAAAPRGEPTPSAAASAPAPAPTAEPSPLQSARGARAHPRREDPSP